LQPIVRQAQQLGVAVLVSEFWGAHCGVLCWNRDQSHDPGLRQCRTQPRTGTPFRPCNSSRADSPVLSLQAADSLCNTVCVVLYDCVYGADLLGLAAQGYLSRDDCTVGAFGSCYYVLPLLCLRPKQSEGAHRCDLCVPGNLSVRSVTARS